MADVNVNFLHPTDGRVISVTMDDTMTAQEIIAELLANNFVSPAPGGYELFESGNLLREDQTLADAGVRHGCKIRVTPSTNAGAWARR